MTENYQMKNVKKEWDLKKMIQTSDNSKIMCAMEWELISKSIKQRTKKSQNFFPLYIIIQQSVVDEKLWKYQTIVFFDVFFLPMLESNTINKYKYLELKITIYAYQTNCFKLLTIELKW